MKTRKPTGLAPWPIVLIAGAEKAGKSWSAAEATGHPMIRDAYWIGIGEDDPDEYANVPGADFNIVEHDGSFRQIRDAILEVSQIPQDPANPDLLIVDSMGRLWALLSDMAQAEANQRAREKAAKYNRQPPAEEVPISMDLWNRAKGRWGEVLDLLRSFQGPVILTARLSSVTVMDEKGQPTKEKTDKIEAEKNLPYDVAAVVKMPERGVAFLSGVRSAVLQLEKPTRLNDFTVANLWDAMGVGKDMGERRHAGKPVESPASPPEAPAQEPQEAPQDSADPAPTDDIVDAEIVQDDTTQQWVVAVYATDSRDALMAVFEDARSKGAHTLPEVRAAFADHGQKYPKERAA